MPPKNTAKKKKQEQLAVEVKRIRKDPDNLICADCPVRSTPYVCIDYSSFICTGCAGIHREFNHRVKSIAVATFTEKEVDQIREGGNSNLNRKYLAKYKKHKDSFSLPREGEKEKIKQYIQLKYIDKKWFKERAERKKKKKDKKKKKKEKRKKKKSVSLSDNAEDDDKAADEQIADFQSPSQSNHSASAHTTPQHHAATNSAGGGAVDDMLSFDAFSSPPTQSAPQPQHQPRRAQSGQQDDWGNFGGDGANGMAPDSNAGGAPQDTSGWDPFASSPAPQTHSAQSNGLQNNNMGWDDTLWNDQPSGGHQQPPPPQQREQQQPPRQQQSSPRHTASANADDLWGDFNGGNQQQMAPQQAPPQQLHQQRNSQKVLGLYAHNSNGNVFQSAPQHQMAPQQQHQPLPAVSSTGDLWGAIANINEQSAQQQQAALQKQKEAEAAAAAKRSAEAKKKEAFSDPFATLVSGIDGVQASDQPQPPQQQQPAREQPARQNSLMAFGANSGRSGHRNSGHGQQMAASVMAPQQNMGYMASPLQQQANPYLPPQGNPYLAQQPPPPQQQQAPQQQGGYGGNPYLGQQQQGNPYLGQQPQPQGAFRPQQPQQPNPYMQSQAQFQQGNPYMATQPVQGGGGGAFGGGAANPFR